jgi:RNA recognition motif-containing protein
MNPTIKAGAPVDVYGKRLYVGGLDFRADKKDLRALFSAAGRVADVYTPFQDAGALAKGERPVNRGYAFVEMGTLEEARRAVLLLDGKEDPYGRRISVRFAKVKKG